MALRTHTTAALSVVTTITRRLGSALADLVPIIVVVAFFQVVVLRQPFPQLGEIVLGGVLVVFGLMLFIEGLEIGLFPIGEAMADALAQKGSLFWLFTFSFALGFSTTVAEPALIAVSDEAARIAADGDLIENSDGSRANYALGLRLSVAFSVGFAIPLHISFTAYIRSARSAAK